MVTIVTLPSYGQWEKVRSRFDGIAFPIGGATTTPWTVREARSAGHLVKIPVWVAGPETSKLEGENDGAVCREILRDIGVPNGELVALDVTVTYDVDYIHAFEHAVMPYLTLLKVTPAFTDQVELTNGGLWLQKRSGHITSYDGFTLVEHTPDGGVWLSYGLANPEVFKWEYTYGEPEATVTPIRPADPRVVVQIIESKYGDLSWRYAPHEPVEDIFATVGGLYTVDPVTWQRWCDAEAAYNGMLEDLAAIVEDRRSSGSRTLERGGQND